MKFYRFRQNNSGGSFDIDDESGIGPVVWIEADNFKHANARAINLGIYFDGVKQGRDCDCCGDRWHEMLCEGFYASEDPEGEINPEYDFSNHHTVYVHMNDTAGTIVRISQP